LTEGRHKLFVRGWDVYNNPGEIEVEFEVYQKPDITIIDIKAYPNPVKKNAVFNLTLEGDTRESKVMIAILSGDGRVVWTQERAINEANLRSLEIAWDGPGKQEGRLPPGEYFCRVIVINRIGLKTSKTVKLVVL
jgi:flagellar hook assembly protein FlgD